MRRPCGVRPVARHRMSPTCPEPELREKVLTLTYLCPRGKYVADCPFCALGGLSHESRKKLLARMSAEQLLQLFDLPGECKCPDDPRG